jgi:hypothetical protein
MTAIACVSGFGTAGIAGNTPQERNQHATLSIIEIPAISFSRRQLQKSVVKKV